MKVHYSVFKALLQECVRRTQEYYEQVEGKTLAVGLEPLPDKRSFWDESFKAFMDHQLAERETDGLEGAFQCLISTEALFKTKVQKVNQIDRFLAENKTTHALERPSKLEFEIKSRLDLMDCLAIILGYRSFDDLWDNSALIPETSKRIQQLFLAETFGSGDLIRASVRDRLAQFQGTSWYFYYYDYANTNHVTRIDRLLFRIDSIYDYNGVVLEGHHGEASNNFVGRVSLDKCTANNLICELRTRDTSQKALRLHFHIDQDGINRLYLGQFMDYENNNKIVSGTAVIERVSDDAAVLPPRFVSYDDEEACSQVAAPLRHLFEDKHLNFTRTPTDIYDHEALRRWLNEKDSLSRGMYSWSWPQPHPYKWDVFIASPVRNLPGRQYEELEQGILDIMDELKDLGFKTIYYATEQYADEVLTLESWALLEREVDNFFRSKVLFVIMPQFVMTSALLQLGWAMVTGKPTIVFSNNLDESVPFLAKKHPLITIPETEIDLPRGIPAWLSRNKVTLERLMGQIRY